MATSVTCPRCGAANNPGTMFCVNCGSSLSGGGTAPSAPPPMYPAAPYGAPVAGLPSAWDAERRKQIDRTKTGVLLLLIGTLIAWIPLIGVVGGLLTLIGAILVILGRKAFGSAHARNVFISILLFIVGIIFVGVAAVVLVNAIATGFLGGTPNPAAVSSALNNYLIILAVGSIIGGLASIFFTYELQSKPGRMLLFAGYGASVAINIAASFVISQTIPTVLAAMFPGGTYNPTAAAAALADFSARVRSLALLSVIPALLYSAANYIAWSRINRGEIPPPTTPPSMPTMAPSAPPR